MRHRCLNVERLEDRRLLAVRFAVIGDWGSSSINADYVANMIKHEDWDVDLILTTGDNNYGQIDLGHSNWESLVGARYGAFIQRRSDGKYQLQTSDVQRFFPTVGNHDSTADGTGQIGLSGGIIPGYIDYFVTNPSAGDRLGPGNGRHLETESFYDYRWGPIHFFAVDSDHARVDAASMAAQQSWLQTTMAASDATWKFVYFHHSPYSSSAVHGDDPAMQWDFAAWGADAVLSGHDHIYERIIGPQDGLPYFVSGLGGRQFYPLGIPTAGSQFRYSGNYGAMRVTVDGDEASFEFLSIDDGANGHNGGKLIDTFAVTHDTGEVIDPPTVLEVVRNDGELAPTELDSLAFVFSKDVTSSLNQNDLSISNAHTNTTILIGANSLNPTQARWDFSIVSLAAGFYRVTLNAQGIADAQGNLLDGNGDGLSGDSWEGLFLVALPGDANLNGAIDGTDYGLWMKDAAVVDWGHGDFNQDGAVNEIDYGLWESNKFTDLRIPGPISDRVPRAPISTIMALPEATMPPGELSFFAGLTSFQAEKVWGEPLRRFVRDVPRLEAVVSSLPNPRRSWSARHGKIAVDSAPADVDQIFADELAEILLVDEGELHPPPLNLG